MILFFLGDLMGLWPYLPGNNDLNVENFGDNGNKNKFNFLKIILLTKLVIFMQK